MRVYGAVLLLIGALPACGGKGTSGRGPQVDGRLTSDVYTWLCGTLTDTGVDDAYAGVFSQSVALQYAPDALEGISLPSKGGCTADLGMFPVDAGGEGVDVGSGRPGWKSAAGSGSLDKMATGFYKDEVFENYLSCQSIDEVLSGGLQLQDADDLDDVITPEPGQNSVVHFDPDPQGGVAWGTETEVSWSQSGWDEVWVQIRRERTGELWASVTCNVTGLGSFTIDDAVWSLLGDDVAGTSNNLYVAFQNTAVVETSGGQKVEAVTRAISVAVVNEE